MNITKKEYKAFDEEVKNLIDLFIRQNWERYHEEDYTKKNYFKKIIFSYKNKLSQETYLTKKQYEQWRSVLENEILKNIK